MREVRPAPPQVVERVVLLVLVIDPQHHEVRIAAELLVERQQVLVLQAALEAPRRPEVQHHDLPLELIERQRPARFHPGAREIRRLRPDQDRRD